MATCTARKVETTYTLEMTEREAVMLHQLITSHIAGSGCDPLSDVMYALRKASVPDGKHRIVRRDSYADDAVLLVDHHS